MTKHQAIEYILSYFTERETLKSEKLSYHVLALLRSSMNTSNINEVTLRNVCETIRRRVL